MLSSIYQDDRTELNVMSFLTPVYLHGKLKGIVMVDINKHNLQNIVFTHDRPLVWRYLNASVTDTDSDKTIIIHQSENNLFPYVNYISDLLVVCTSSCHSISCISLSRPGSCFCFTFWQLPCSSIWSGCIFAFTIMLPVKISAMR